MNYEFTINGTLPGLNDYTKANRTNPYMGGKMKKDAEERIMSAIRSQLGKLQISKPVILKYMYFEPHKRRDHDNVASFAMKVIQDSLVKCMVLKNDGWNEITGFIHTFVLDKKNPRIEVTIVEANNAGE